MQFLKPRTRVDNAFAGQTARLFKWQGYCRKPVTSNVANKSTSLPNSNSPLALCS